jgi:hypothetical protein
MMTKKNIILKKGESGYYPLTNEAETVMSLDELNGELGVTRGQREAMYIGSLFGWDVPGANPAMYGDDGMPIEKPKGKKKK